MKPVHFLIMVASMFSFLGLGGAQAGTMQGHLLDHEARRLNSDETVNLKEAYAGKVVLVVNTASKCAFTGQY